MTKKPFPSLSLLTALVAGFLPLAGRAGAASAFSNVDVAFKGAGWLKSGRIMHSTDSITGTPYNNYNDNWLQDAGVLFTGIANLNPHFEAAFGLGAIQKHPAQGTLFAAKDVKLGMNIFTTQSRLTWYPQGKQDYSLKFDFGLFPYKYDNNIKNLGLYLIRGPVYPGLLISGFEAKEMLNTANMLGAHMQNRFGAYTQDLILTSENDIKPYFDFSAIYVGTLKAGEALEFGAGVNFYHYLPVRPGATSPSEADGYDPASRNQAAVKTPFDYNYAVPIDTAIIPPAQRTDPNDSLHIDYTWPSHKGIKLMARFAFDPQALMGSESALGRNDLKLYGETGIIGVQNYKGVYDKISERIPVMLGFNIPTFKLFDVLALEVEYYGSKLVPDYRKVMEGGSAVPQTVWINRGAPPDTGTATFDQQPYDTGADDIKWSLYMARVFAGHVKISGQVANDHFRTGGTPGLSGKSYEEALTHSNDWYWFLKLSYFF